MDPVDPKDVTTPSSSVTDVKTASTASSEAGDTSAGSPPAKKASDTPAPPAGKSHREALIASLSQEKKEETPSDEDDEEPEVPATETDTSEVVEETTPEPEAEKPAGDADVVAKPDQAKKSVLIDNLRNLSAEKKRLEPFKNFAVPILKKLDQAKIPPAAFHQLTDTMVHAHAAGLAPDKIDAWVKLGTETLTAEDAAERLYQMAVDRGYKPADTTPKLSAEDEAWIQAQEKNGLIEASQAAELRKRMAKAPAPVVRKAAPPAARQPAPAQPAGPDPAVKQATLAKMGEYADTVRAQHKISDADWVEVDKKLTARLERAAADAGGEIPINQWLSTFKLVTDAVVADFKRRAAATGTKQVQTSLRPSKAAGASNTTALTERQKVIQKHAS